MVVPCKRYKWYKSLYNIHSFFSTLKLAEGEMTARFYIKCVRNTSKQHHRYWWHLALECSTYSEYTWYILSILIPQFPKSPQMIYIEMKISCPYRGLRKLDVVVRIPCTFCVGMPYRWYLIWTFIAEFELSLTGAHQHRGCTTPFSFQKSPDAPPTRLIRQISPFICHILVSKGPRH